MEATVKTHNMRPGYHTHHAGEIWAENDGPSCLGWKTLVPYYREGVLTPRPSKPVDKATATQIAKAVRDAETWLEAREAIEAIVGKEFFR